MAMSPAGVPLGVISQYIWCRNVKKNSARNFAIPTEEKESYKWVKALEEYSELIKKKTPIITICDREADFFDFFLCNEILEEKFIVRSFHNRRLNDPNEDFKMYERIKSVLPFVQTKKFKQSFNKAPAFPFGSSDQVVNCGYIVVNGAV